MKKLQLPEPHTFILHFLVCLANFQSQKQLYNHQLKSIFWSLLTSSKWLMIMCTYYATYIALNFFNHQITSFWSWNFKLITFLPLSFIEWVTIHFYLDWKLSYIFTHLKYIRLKLSTFQPYHRMFDNYDIEFLFSSINVKLSAWTKCAVFCTVHVYCKFYSRTSLIYKIQTLITFVK